MARALTGETYLLQAGELNASDHIGRPIRFRLWDNTRETSTVITGELRQISHKSDETFVTYGYGAEVEATLGTDQPVSVNPPADHSDVAQLAAYDERV